MSVHLAIAPINWSNDDDHSLGGTIPLDKCLSEMRTAGFTGCELGHKFPKSLVRLKKTLSNYGLRVTSDWIGTELTVRGRFNDTINNFAKRVEFLHQLGVKALKVCECGHALQNTERPVFSSKVRFTTEQWNNLRAGLHKMAEIAHKKSMYIAYHQHLGTGIQDHDELEQLMDITDPELVTLLPDTGHLYAAQINPLEIFKRYQHRIRYIHLKDVRADVLHNAREQNMSFMDAVRAGLFTVPGDGCIDFRSIFTLLKKAQFSGWMVVEAEQDPKIAPPLLYAKKAHTFLTQFFRGV